MEEKGGRRATVTTRPRPALKTARGKQPRQFDSDDDGDDYIPRQPPGSGLVVHRHNPRNYGRPARPALEAGGGRDIAPSDSASPSPSYSPYISDEDVHLRHHRINRPGYYAGPPPKPPSTILPPWNPPPEHPPTWDPFRGGSAFQTVCDTENPKDATVHLELQITEAVEDELEVFSRLRRLGDFRASKKFFKDNLEEYIANPYVFVQYAEMLLEMGDYKTLSILDLSSEHSSPFATRAATDGNKRAEPQARAAGHEVHFHGPPPPPPVDSYTRESQRPVVRIAGWHEDSRPQPESRGPPLKPRAATGTSRVRSRSISPGEMRRRVVTGEPLPQAAATRADQPNDTDELGLLHWNWRLLNALSLIYRDNLVAQAHGEVVAALNELHFELQTMGSTEIQILSLTLRICGYIKNCLPDVFALNLRGLLEKWVDWEGLHRHLLAEDRLWDFRDLAAAAVLVFGHKYLGKLDAETLQDYKGDGVACLALLDLTVSVTLESDLTTANLRDMGPLILSSKILAEEIMARHPWAMRSRAYMRWMLAKAAESGLKEDSGVPDSFGELFRFLETSPGLPFFRRDWITLPIYVPRDAEIPGWAVPQVPPEMNQPVHLALSLAKELDDYATQVLSYKLLALRSQEPRGLLQELAGLQGAVQGDRIGCLQTHLSSFIGCHNLASQRQLLDDLADFENWDDDELDIRDPEVFWAKDFIQRALSQKADRRHGLPPPTASEMAYYQWLPGLARSFIKEVMGFVPQATGSTRTRGYGNENVEPLSSMDEGEPPRFRIRRKAQNRGEDEDAGQVRFRPAYGQIPFQAPAPTSYGPPTLSNPFMQAPPKTTPYTASQSYNEPGKVETVTTEVADQWDQTIRAKPVRAADASSKKAEENLPPVAEEVPSRVAGGSELPQNTEEGQGTRAMVPYILRGKEKDVEEDDSHRDMQRKDGSSRTVPARPSDVNPDDDHTIKRPPRGEEKRAADAQSKRTPYRWADEAWRQRLMKRFHPDRLGDEREDKGPSVSHRASARQTTRSRRGGTPSNEDGNYRAWPLNSAKKPRGREKAKTAENEGIRVVPGPTGEAFDIEEMISNSERGSEKDEKARSKLPERAQEAREEDFGSASRNPTVENVTDYSSDGHDQDPNERRQGDPWGLTSGSPKEAGKEAGKDS